MNNKTMQYTGINIGPIIPTFSMVRKPRELWTASYMFSYLMKCIIDQLCEENIISPAKLPENADKTIGLYPDRVFVKGEVTEEQLNKAFDAFVEGVGLKNIKDDVRPYFNIMVVTKDFNENETEHLMALNGLLDRMELYNHDVDEAAKEAVFDYLRNPGNVLAKTVGKEFKNHSIETIASYDIFEGDKVSSDKDKSDKYICIVQADGDKMGEVVSSLQEKDVALSEDSLSAKLLAFGQECCKTIRDYGGLPIYAGGDDLLFLAPVLTSKGSIFDLIKKLDEHYEKVQAFVAGKKKEIQTTMSYGISMTYYKYPLYEALEKARDALFDTAKNKIEGKNAVVWTLQKHSGSSFKASLSKNLSDLYNALLQVINATESEQLVSAVSHKIRQNEVLLSLWLDDKQNMQQRISNFFDKIIDVEGKSDAAVKYMESVQTLLLEVYNNADSLSGEEDKLKKMKELTNIVYGMLRTAKFVKGKEE